MTHSSWIDSGRPPAVAGMFYPGESRGIEHAVEQWCSPDTERDTWRAALIPHAGWMYSGRTAANVLQRIKMPPTVVVLCPKHRAGGVECAVAPWQQWLYPGGVVEVDDQLSQRLAAEVPILELDDRPHLQEHAIEVQLPLLARFAPESKLVAITIGRVSFQQCQLMADNMADLLVDQLDDILLVVSSDMNHFGSLEDNRNLDSLAIKALDELDPEQLYETCHRHRITMCGMLPAVIVLTMLKKLDAVSRAVQVEYTTSAEASGDTQRVVGYAGMLFD